MDPTEVFYLELLMLGGILLVSLNMPGVDQPYLSLVPSMMLLEPTIGN
jgi:hypothetical protein